MKWLLIAILVALVMSRRHLVGDLFRTVKKLPKDFDEGKHTLDDPAAAAKDVSDQK